MQFSISRYKNNIEPLSVQTNIQDSKLDKNNSDEME
jgi:hypothetical protein